MKITREEVQHVARLARLELDESELDKFTTQLDSILAYMDKLRSLNVEEVPPTYHALEDLTNVLREDKVGQTLPLEKTLKNAPEREGNFFKVPRIVEEQE